MCSATPTDAPRMRSRACGNASRPRRRPSVTARAASRMTEHGRARRRPGRAARAHARAQAAGEGRQGRLRLERSARGAGENPRGSRRDRSRARRRRESRRSRGEIGDLLFALVNLARHLGSIRKAPCAAPMRNSNAASRRSSARSPRRGKAPQEATLAEMDALWNEAKAGEKKTAERRSRDTDEALRPPAQICRARSAPWPDRRARSLPDGRLRASVLVEHLGVAVQPVRARAVGGIERNFEHDAAFRRAAPRSRRQRVRALPRSPPTPGPDVGRRPPFGEISQRACALPHRAGRSCSRPRSPARAAPRRCRARAAPPRRRAICASLSSCEMSRTCRMTSASITSSSVARNAATSMVGRSEMKPTVSDRMTRAPCGRASARKRRIERREQHVGFEHGGAGQAVEQRRLAGIGVADQRDDRIRHALAALAMQLAALLDLLQLGLDASDALARSRGGRPRSASRRGRRESRSRRAGAPDASRSAPAGSSGRSDARVRPAARLPWCARAGRRFPGSGRCGRAPWRSRPSRDCAAAPARARNRSRPASASRLLTSPAISSTLPVPI